MMTAKKPNAKPRRTKRACAQRGRKLRASGDPKAASRLARYCPPPGRRKRNAAAGRVEVVQVDAAKGRGGLVVYLMVPRGDRSVMVTVRASAAGALALPAGLPTAERSAVEAAAGRAVAARRRLEAEAKGAPQMSMADVRRLDPDHFRDTSRFGGGYPGSKFFGPYTGPNGTYFVQEYPTPREFRPKDGPTSWAISQVDGRGVDRTDIDDYRSRADAIRFAKDLALGD